MSLLQRFVSWCGLVLIAVVLGGVYRNRLSRICRWFPAYLLAVLVAELAIMLWSKQLFNWEFYVTKEAVYGVLKLILAIDLGATMFAAFPGAAATARHASLLALSCICAVLVAAHPAGARLDDLAVELQPRLANGTAFLLLTLWGLAIFYHVPTHRFHRAILAGLSAYLLLATVIVGYFVLPHSPIHELASLANSFGYLVLLAYWIWEAWRPEPPAPGSPDVMRRLQPWR